MAIRESAIAITRFDSSYQQRSGFKYASTLLGGSCFHRGCVSYVDACIGTPVVYCVFIVKRSTPFAILVLTFRSNFVKNNLKGHFNLLLLNQGPPPGAGAAGLGGADIAGAGAAPDGGVWGGGALAASRVSTGCAIASEVAVVSVPLRLMLTCGCMGGGGPPAPGLPGGGCRGINRSTSLSSPSLSIVSLTNSISALAMGILPLAIACSISFN